MGTSLSDNDDDTDCQYVRCAVQKRKLSYRLSTATSTTSTTQHPSPTSHPPEYGCKLKLPHVSNKRLPWHSTQLNSGHCHVSMHLSAYVPRDSQLPLVPLFQDTFPGTLKETVVNFETKTKSFGKSIIKSSTKTIVQTTFLP